MKNFTILQKISLHGCKSWGFFFNCQLYLVSVAILLILNVNSRRTFKMIYCFCRGWMRWQCLLFLSFNMKRIIVFKFIVNKLTRLFLSTYFQPTIIGGNRQQAVGNKRDQAQGTRDEAVGNKRTRPRHGGWVISVINFVRIWLRKWKIAGLQKERMRDNWRITEG